MRCGGRTGAPRVTGQLPVDEEVVPRGVSFERWTVSSAHMPAERAASRRDSSDLQPRDAGPTEPPHLTPRSAWCGRRPGRAPRRATARSRRGVRAPPVPDRLARCGQRLRRERSTSSTRPASRIARSVFDAAPSTSGGARCRRPRPGTPWCRTPACPARTTRRAPEADDLERTHDPARCPARCVPRRGRSANSAYATARPSGVDTSASNSAEREIFGRERQWIDDGLQVQPGAPTRSAFAAPRCRRPRRARRPGSALTSLPRDRRRRRDGAGSQPAHDGWAWRSDVDRVHLHRVDRDDLDVPSARHGEAEIGLAGRGPTSARCVTQVRRSRGYGRVGRPGRRGGSGVRRSRCGPGE